MSNNTPVDETWPMVEEAVMRLFGDIAAGQSAETEEHTAVAPRLDELGWADIVGQYPIDADRVLFRAQGQSLAQTDCLDRVMLAELSPLPLRGATRVVLPAASDGYTPRSDSSQVSGIVLGPLVPGERLVVPVAGTMGTVSIGVVDGDELVSERLNTFDASTYWTSVRGPLTGPLTEASTEWNRAIAAAHRSLATESVAIAREILRIAIDQVTVRAQYGTPIGAFQSPRHALAQAHAQLEGADALVTEAWMFGGRLPAQAAKAAAGRATRGVADVALQVCGAIGLTAEHPLHRYVGRAFQIDALAGSYHQLERGLADRVFDIYAPDRALPSMMAWHRN
ncbi:acyl-CoA dehydrogenase family protein [Gordonia hydrophobica]|uniref:Acyl-CoA dehydrogenase family protein n=1 Tax=Gordonia hydrophobica TaxID=40516 RepID=A0ABZ2U2N1_9ACTN|nr:acyl-CoA dehydrogenase family protein [Gordonia hydrophobica]MBM7369230.1 hypothetical protein [Gordonia hydrophobica]